MAPGVNNMTPEEISAINKRLSEWAGITPQIECASDSVPPCIGPCKGCEDVITHYPEFFRSNAAMDLLQVLASREYWWEMKNCKNGDKSIRISSWHGVGVIAAAQQPTIPAAICRACLEVAEREGKE